MATEKPFGQELDRLLIDREMSQRELARLIDDKLTSDEYLSTYSISRIVREELPPTLRSIESISKALNVRPDTFAEYRMLKLRSELNPQKVGWKKALATLRRLER